MTMNLLVITLNYSPEPTGYGQRVALLADYLVNRGHEVTVITGFPFMPYWSRYPEYRGRFTLRESNKGVCVTRLSHFVPARPKSIFQRLLLEGSFSVAAASLLLIGRRPPQWDGVLYVGTHPSVAMMAGVYANLWKLPYVVKITDLASELASETGIVKQRWLHNLFSRFEYAAFRRSQGAIALCDGFRDALESHGYPREQVRVIPNSVDLENIRPLNKNNGFRVTHGLLEEDFLLLYSGSLSMKQGLHTLLETARLLKPDYPHLKWVIVGDGDQKSRLIELIEEYNLGESVLLLPLQPPNLMSAMYSASDVLLLPQLAEIKDTVIPGKLLTYLAAGRPILASVNPDNQTAKTLQRAGGGIIVPPEDPTSMANAVKQLLRSDTINLDLMGQQNRDYAELNFDNQKILAAQEEFLIEVFQKTKS